MVSRFFGTGTLVTEDAELYTEGHAVVRYFIENQKNSLTIKAFLINNHQ